MRSRHTPSWSRRLTPLVGPRKLVHDTHGSRIDEASANWSSALAVGSSTVALLACCAGLHACVKFQICHKILENSEFGIRSQIWYSLLGLA